MNMFDILNRMDSACPVSCDVSIVRKSPCEVELQWSFYLKKIRLYEGQVINSFEGLESVERSINSASLNIRASLERLGKSS